MSRLTNFIEKTFKGYTKVKSDVSNSVYYHVGPKCIRISDHNVVSSSTGDINIIIPNNIKTVYIVNFKGNNRPLAFTYPELKALILSLKLMWEVGYSPSNVDEELVSKKYKRALEMVKEEKDKAKSLEKEIERLKFDLSRKDSETSFKQELSYLTDKQRAHINSILRGYKRQLGK